VDDNGKFVVISAPPGVYEVAVEPPKTGPGYGMPQGSNPPPKDAPRMAGGGGAKGTPVQLPAQYADPKASGLTWDTKKEGPKKDFQLTE
jgi:hypothetical protein